jgi:hypothetical protein
MVEGNAKEIVVFVCKMRGRNLSRTAFSEEPPECTDLVYLFVYVVDSFSDFVY